MLKNVNNWPMFSSLEIHTQMLSSVLSFHSSTCHWFVMSFKSMIQLWTCAWFVPVQTNLRFPCFTETHPMVGWKLLGAPGLCASGPKPGKNYEWGIIYVPEKLWLRQCAWLNLLPGFLWVFMMTINNNNYITKMTEASSLVCQKLAMAFCLGC